MPALIPLSRPDITQREIDAVIEVLSTPTLSIGPWLEEFERLTAQLTGRRHAVGVSSGTAGLHCAMIAAGIRPDDEVITTPFSFVASANCILYVGAKPVFVDINPQTLNIDLDKVVAAITPKTRGIVGVEVFGHPGGMPELEQIAQKHQLVLIEDSCEGLGGMAGKRPIGSFGRASIFGFYPNKQITTGEGGMIVTDDENFASTCRALRNQGREGMAWLAHERLGYNYRLSEINAALGVAQMQRLEELTENRHRVAVQYIERLMTSKFVIVPTILENTVMSWFVFVVRLNDLFEHGNRDEAIKELRAAGIGCSNYFPPIHLQPYMVNFLGHKPGDFPVCEHVANRTIALPFFGKMSKAQIERVCNTLEKVLEKILISRKGRF
ncbi:MAG TPA: DegT/DnrJ/EryC1/StrS family aminotransferase [Tepidisphaeraceae bacterium]|jgi:perosamine synthetase|nr:DegT/DnrJ/EryC1/StrS family aminotransferase [Tepidisphaeraceae bacterium]